ncbi:hypothetical protein KDL01_15005 [Actinospica durhamensis]|uniref:Uncharacterized protein n=1 Tax=Actinospica durhamensis TaxID=1508375 RepID=A0A941ITQ1_9ACTN|nr:hypothetical protein [Actinospica durhamensis]MBR7834581.1 hypothetical protein [Actinospica durhamensis]
MPEQEEFAAPAAAETPQQDGNPQQRDAATDQQPAVAPESTGVAQRDAEVPQVPQQASVPAAETFQEESVQTDSPLTQTAQAEVLQAEALQPQAPPAGVPPFGAQGMGAQGTGAFPVPAWGAWPAVEPKPKRPVPWRWIGAVVTAAAVGAGCAFAVMAPRRTDLPGLQTASDGRYVFAPLTLPTLAAGQDVPSADPAGRHLADIRKLLLPAPQGAVSDHAVTLTDGWLSQSDSLKLTVADSARMDFGQYGWRHTAAESWKTSDGAETKIYLLQFSSQANASTAETTLAEMTGVPTGAATTTLALDDQILTYFKVSHGSTNTWYGIASVRDTVLEIVYTAPSSVGIAPFRQEFSLQTELLE